LTGQAYGKFTFAYHNGFKVPSWLPHAPCRDYFTKCCFNQQ